MINLYCYLKKLYAEKNIIFLSLIILVISLSNFWIYWIYQSSFLLGEILLIETVLLFLTNSYPNTKVMPILIFTILFILGIFLLAKNFNESIFSISAAESVVLNRRHEFYGPELGKIYKNRFGLFYFKNLRLYFSKISNNLFSALDLNTYFSPGRVLELGKYPLFFSPFFILGFLSLIKGTKKIFIIYLISALIISSFINLDSKVGSILFFPFISLSIALGLSKSIEKLGRLILPLK